MRTFSAYKRMCINQQESTDTCRCPLLLVKPAVKLLSALHRGENDAGFNTDTVSLTTLCGRLCQSPPGR